MGTNDNHLPDLLSYFVIISKTLKTLIFQTNNSLTVPVTVAWTSLQKYNSYCRITKYIAVFDAFLPQTAV